MRIIQQAAEALARAMRLALAKQPEEAEQQLAEAYSVLGIDRELLLVLDAPTLLRQLGDDDKAAMAARLLLGEAELRNEKGEHKAAIRRLKAARRLAERLRTPNEVLESELRRTSRLLESAG